MSVVKAYEALDGGVEDGGLDGQVSLSEWYEAGRSNIGEERLFEIHKEAVLGGDRSCFLRVAMGTLLPTAVLIAQSPPDVGFTLPALLGGGLSFALHATWHSVTDYEDRLMRLETEVSIDSTILETAILSGQKEARLLNARLGANRFEKRSLKRNNAFVGLCLTAALCFGASTDAAKEQLQSWTHIINGTTPPALQQDDWFEVYPAPIEEVQPEESKSGSGSFYLRDFA